MSLPTRVQGSNMHWRCSRMQQQPLQARWNLPQYTWIISVSHNLIRFSFKVKSFSLKSFLIFFGILFNDNPLLFDNWEYTLKLDKANDIETLKLLIRWSLYCNGWLRNHMESRLSNEKRISWRLRRVKVYQGMNSSFAILCCLMTETFVYFQSRCFHR